MFYIKQRTYIGQTVPEISIHSILVTVFLQVTYNPKIKHFRGQKISQHVQNTGPLTAYAIMIKVILEGKLKVYKRILCQLLVYLLIGYIIKHFSDLCRIFHRCRDGVRGA